MNDRKSTPGTSGKIWALLMGILVAGGVAGVLVDRLFDIVNPPNKGPTAKLHVHPKDRGPAPLHVRFDAVKSEDPEGEELQYAWYIENEHISNTEIFDYFFEEEGSYRVVLEVTDARQAKDREAVYVSVEPPKGVALHTASKPATLPVGPQKATITLELSTLSKKEAFAQTICSPVVNTIDLHNVKCKPGCICPGDGKWCFREYPLTVRSTRDDRILRNARMECVRDNQGSCSWNMLGHPERTILRQWDDQRGWEGVAIVNSRSIGIRLCADEFKFLQESQRMSKKEWRLHSDGSLVAEIPKGATGLFRIKWDDGREEAVQAGEETRTFALVNENRDVSGATVLTYRLVSL